jgi:hypothetical protein
LFYGPDASCVFVIVLFGFVVSYHFVFHSSEPLCQVCVQRHASETLVRCRTCQVPAHQDCLSNSCFSEAPDDRSSFLCPACHLKQRSNALSCVLCDRSGSLMQPVFFGGTPYRSASLTHHLKASECQEGWAHSLCIRWIPDLWFEFDMRSRIDLSSLHPARQALSCNLCRNAIDDPVESSLKPPPVPSRSRSVKVARANKLPVSCVQCTFGKCTFAYHVSCAAEQGRCYIGLFAFAFLF